MLNFFCLSKPVIEGLYCIIENNFKTSSKRDKVLKCRFGSMISKQLKIIDRN